jgi:hypothetical protein
MPHASIDSIPQELRTLQQWLIYYLKPNAKPGKKPTKHPTVKYAAPEHKANLRPLDALLSRPLTKGGGYQILVNKGDGYVFVDIDKCRNAKTGELSPEARAIVASLDTYCEISASGTGLHLICRASLDDDFHVDGHPVEIYSGNIPNKLIAMTGDILEGNSIVASRQTEVWELLKQCQTDVGAVAKHAAAVEQQSTSELTFKKMSEVQARPIKWLWRNRIPLSAVTLLTGNPGIGKTMAYCDIAARVSSCRPFPDVPDRAHGGHVILLAAEDSYDAVLRPRLEAAGANLSNIVYIEKVVIRQGANHEERMFALDSDLSKLDKALSSKAEISASLVIIDPLSAYFGKGNMNNKQEVRDVFSRLQVFCEKFDLAVAAVEHHNKRTDVAAIHKLGGSVALTGGARSVLMFAKVPDEDGQHVMHVVKGNLAKKKTGLRYTIEDKQVGKLPDPVPYLAWGAEDAGTADELLQAEKGVSETNRAARAAKFLREFLTQEKPSAEVEAEATKRNISRSALYEVKKELGIRAEKRGGQWFWYPAQETGF